MNYIVVPERGMLGRNMHCQCSLLQQCIRDRIVRNIELLPPNLSRLVLYDIERLQRRGGWLGLHLLSQNIDYTKDLKRGELDTNTFRQCKLSVRWRCQHTEQHMRLDCQ